MNVTKCTSGHFYDADTYTVCPHCNAGIERGDNLTAPLSPFAATSAPESFGGDALTSNLTKPVSERSETGDDASTVAFFEKKSGFNPVVGWLVCVEGAQQGLDFRLHSGRNFIGRAKEMDVAITGDISVSRDRHAVLVYEPKNHVYMVTPGEAKELCYLNGEVVLSPRKVEANDVIALGNTELMFFPCCSEGFNWNEIFKDGESAGK